MHGPIPPSSKPAVAGQIFLTSHTLTFSVPPLLLFKDLVIDRGLKSWKILV